MLIATIFITPKLDTIQLSAKSKMDKLSAVNSYHRISYGGNTESNIHTTRTNFRRSRNTVSTENPKSQKNAYSLTAFYRKSKLCNTEQYIFRDTNTQSINLKKAGKGYI